MRGPRRAFIGVHTREIVKKAVRAEAEFRKTSMSSLVDSILMDWVSGQQDREQHFKEKR